MASTSTRRFERICVFCGSFPGKFKVFEEAALRVGQVLAKQKIQLIYGGGSLGLKGAVATTVHVEGGSVLGIIPKAFTKNRMCGPTLGKEMPVRSISERLSTMTYLADAFIALPGGLGTLEELICITSWASLAMHKKPIGLLNINGYFNSFLAFLDNAVENGFMFSVSRRILVSATTIEELLFKLQTFEYSLYSVVPKIDWSEKSIKDSDKRELDLTLHL